MQMTEHCMRRGSHFWRTYISISVSVGRGVWAVAVSLCLSPWPHVQCRLQMQDCSHCKILPHLPWCKMTDLKNFRWLRYDSIWVLFPIITWMEFDLGNSSDQTLCGENHLLSDACLGVYGAVPGINFTSAMAQLPEERIRPVLWELLLPTDRILLVTVTVQISINILTYIHK